MHRRELEREYEQDSQFDDFDNLQDGEKEELIILQEEIDPDYEPTEDQIFQYADYIGMDLQRDMKYLYLARQGL